MKALEKAAKDRGSAKNEAATAPAPPGAAPPAAPAAEPTPASVTSANELTLQPLVADTPSVSARAEPGPRVAPPPPPPPRPTVTEPSPEKAATVVQAGQRSSSGAGSYVRAHPLMIIGGLGALLGIGFGVYVYLQITNPGLFRPKPPPPVAGPVAQGPAVPPVTEGALPPALPSAPIIASGPEAPPPSAPAAAPPTPTAAPARPAPSRAEPQPDSGRPGIRIMGGSTGPVLNPQANQAYEALQGARYADAERLYRDISRADPQNVEALLGLAAIAMQDNRAEEATRAYVRILELDPRNALAQSGLISLVGRADPLAAETRLKQLIARDPSPFLYFTLGNVYADQSRWAQAQQAYFQAHHLEPTNPEYAFNLAVGMEHLSQPKVALGFYRQAVKLAETRGRANFSVPQAQERIARLAAQVE
jgi:Tfp pilus assembly protein PilF